MKVKFFSTNIKLNKFQYTVDSSDKFPFLTSVNSSKIKLFDKPNKDTKVIKPSTLNKINEKSINKPKLGKLPIDYFNSLSDSQSLNSFNNSNNQNLQYFNFLIAGKSNVGKSSLINALFNKRIVSTSKTPGKTNTLSFINNDHLKLSIVDSPGYGFANRSSAEIKSWEKMMQEYITSSNNLKSIILLIDSENGITNLDEGCVKLASFKLIELVVVFTKCDKLRSEDYYNLRVSEARNLITKGKTLCNYIFFTSCNNNIGIKELKSYIISKC